MKSVLIVTEQFTIGGLETHIRGEIIRLSENGVQVHLAAGRAFDDALLPSGLSSVSHGIPLDPTITPDELLTAINRLRQIIREQSIACVHVHPFTSIIPAVAAAELEAIPIAITLHGPASLASYGPLYDFLIKHVILPKSELIVVVSPEVKRLLSIYAADESVAYIPNAVSFADSGGGTLGLNGGDPRWLVISRLDQLKVQGIMDFCIKAKASGIPEVLIVGDGPARDDLLQELERQGLSSYVTLLGASTQVQSLIQRSSGVAGMGRVVLEGLACKKPVVLVGYDGVKGVVDKTLFALAAEENFSGRGLPTVSSSDFSEQLERFVHSDISEVYALAKMSYNDSDTWSLFLDRLSTVAHATPSVVTGLYHSLSGSPIKGTVPYLYSLEVLDRLGVVVCGKHFDPRLSAAASFCRQRMENSSPNQSMLDDGQIASLNQAVLERDGQIASLDQAVLERDAQIASLNQAVADRDGQISSLNQAVLKRDGEIGHLNQAVGERDGRIEALISSRSWRITRPIRVGKRMAQAIKNRELRYALLKRLYWRLPEFLRHRLNAKRHAYVARQLQKRIDLVGRESFGENGSGQSSEWVLRASQAKRVAIVPCGFEFDDLVNQRPINAAKYLADQGYFVVFVPWQWSPQDALSKGCCEVWPGVYQVPLFRFVSEVENLSRSGDTDDFSLFMITMPAPALINLVPLLRQRGFAIIYDIMDEWEAFSKAGQAPWYSRVAEDSLVMHSDYVCGVSPALREKFSNFRSDIGVIGNGYMPNIIGVERRGVAGSQRKEGERIVGYFGHLTDAWFDWDLVIRVARKRQDLSFEIIGYGEPAWVAHEVSMLPNVHVLGKVPPRELHRYAARWSAGIIPFIEGDLAEAVDPIKIYEYLYLGLPTVVTGIRHLQTYPMTYFSERERVHEAIDLAINAELDHEKLVVFLKETTWDARFDALISQARKSQGLRLLYAS